MADSSRPERDARSEPDANLLESLDYTPVPLSPDRMKNFRLIGTGLNPFVVYGSALVFVAAWLFGAYLLSVFGPVFAMILTVGLVGTSLALSNKQTRSEERIGKGLCPRCSYDLRPSNERCPECGTPIPEQILRRRRLRPPLEPGMPGYVAPTPPRVQPPAPPPSNS